MESRWVPLFVVLLALPACDALSSGAQTPTSLTPLPPIVSAPAPTVATTLPPSTTTTILESTTTSIIPPTTSVYASWADVVAAEQSGVFRVIVTNCTATANKFGTGFFVGPNLVVTAAHVVDKSASILLDRVDDDPAPQDAIVIGINIAEDVALLRTSGGPGYQFQFEDVLPAAGAGVGLIGFSGGRVPPRAIQGTVSQPDVPGTPYGDAGQYHPAHVIQHDLQTNGGDSGSPMLDPVTGKVVGINVTTGTDLSGVNFGVQPAAVETLMAAGTHGSPIDECPEPAPTTLPPTTTTTVPPTTVPPTTTTLPVPGKLRYQVLRGDTLFGIAIAFNTTVSAIQAVNDPKAIAVIHPGDVVVLPAGARPLSAKDITTVKYTVQSGDTIISIATANKVTPAELLAVNGKLKSADVLKAGQQLLIPRRG
ncbi:MAG TPA: LysM peptidoglycan-binding domain-containing protein [Ilumatobacteraceae bacterium]|nr:LysM peptidoglycan-binding domain-containing protein [Ilumatobacteraceae bacterium]